MPLCGACPFVGYCVFFSINDTYAKPMIGGSLRSSNHIMSPTPRRGYPRPLGDIPGHVGDLPDERGHPRPVTGGIPDRLGDVPGPSGDVPPAVVRRTHNPHMWVVYARTSCCTPFTHNRLAKLPMSHPISLPPPLPLSCPAPSPLGACVHGSHTLVYRAVGPAGAPLHTHAVQFSSPRTRARCVLGSTR